MKINKLFKKKKKGDNSNFIGEKVKIEILSFSDGLPRVVTTFEANEKRDGAFNLQILNQKLSFKEDVSKVEHHIIKHLKYKFNIRGMSKNQSIAEVELKIQEQEKLIKSYKDQTLETDFPDYFKEDENGDKLIDRFNIYDEENKLKSYKVLLFSIKYNFEDKGSFVKIDAQGFRHYLFEIKEGVLYPYKYLSAEQNVYPHVESLRKFHKEDIEEWNQEYIDERGFKKSLFGKIMIIAFVLLIAGLLMTFIEMQQNSKELRNQIANNNIFLEQISDDQILIVHHGVDINNATKTDEEEKTNTNRAQDFSKKVLG